MPRLSRSSSQTQTPHRRQRVPVRRTVREADQPRMLSSDEKRELILAHAASREHSPIEWGIGYYVGIAASCFVVVAGWWMTLGNNLAGRIPFQSDGFMQTVEQSTAKLNNALHTPDAPTGSDVTAKIDEIKRQYQQAILQAQVMQATANQIQAMTSSTQTHN